MAAFETSRKSIWSSRALFDRLSPSPLSAALGCRGALLSAHQAMQCRQAHCSRRCSSSFTTSAYGRQRSLPPSRSCHQAVAYEHSSSGSAAYTTCLRAGATGAMPSSRPLWQQQQTSCLRRPVTLDCCRGIHNVSPRITAAQPRRITLRACARERLGPWRASASDPSGGRSSSLPAARDKR